MSVKCALAQCQCYTKWENSKCIIGKLIKFKVKKGKHPWTTQSSRLITRIKSRKKEYGNNIKQFYWDNDICKCQLKPGSLTNVPFLIPTSALLNHIMLIVSFSIFIQ